jgi:homoserine kinase type II
MPDATRIAAEFDLGRPVSVRAVPGGRAGVVRLGTARGAFIVKPAYPTDDLELQDQVAVALSAAGLRQARLLRSTAGSLRGSTGHFVQELLPGRIYPQPTAEQTAAVLRYLADYHAALAEVALPAAWHRAETIWSRVASADYLVLVLPGLLRRLSERSGLPQAGGELIDAAIAALSAARPAMSALPRQLVHGDIGPDNVLMQGSEVVAIIDFTPFLEPALFAVATAAYWYQVHGTAEVEVDAIWSSLHRAGARRPWREAETQLWPAMLAREALRRLATPLALADQAEGELPSMTAQRHAAVLALMRSWPALRSR